MSRLCKHADVCFAFATGNRSHPDYMLAVSIFAHPKNAMQCRGRLDKVASSLNKLRNYHQTSHVYHPKNPISSHSCGQELLKALKENVGVLLLEDQHRSEADGLSSRATNVDADGLGVLQNLVTSR
jgi:hypothetical protein